MADKRNIIEINAMLLELLDGKICDERFSLLQDWLRSEPEAIDYYSDFMRNYAALCHHSIPQDEENQWNDSTEDQALWQMLAESEKSAEAIQIDEHRQEEKPQLITEVRKIARRPSRVSRLSLYTAIVSTAALIVILLYVVSNPRISPAVVATLADAIEAKWDDLSTPVQVGDDLRTGPRKLLNGFVQINFDKGAEVLVQSPAEFTLETQDQMFLVSGRVFCRVPSDSAGFVVRTPNACVVDYGTEFGVTARSSGETEAHVFKGTVDLRGGSDPVRFKSFKKLTAGIAGKVDDKGTVSEATFKAQPRQYVKKLPDKDVFARPGVRFDLADVVGGGDGFGSGRFGLVLDPLTEGFISFAELKDRGWYITDKPESTAYIIEELGPSKYILTPFLPYVDGIFVPDVGNVPVRVSSKGHIFHDCPDTNGCFWAGIANHFRLRNNDGFVDWVDMRLGGRLYGTAENPGIFMHANVGITFDLDMIRATLPDTEITSFKALCGMPKSSPSVGRADFYILVDGQVRYKWTGVTARMSTKSVEVQIEQKDKFLTLVTTDFDKNNTNDGCVLALPELELIWKN